MNSMRDYADKTFLKRAPSAGRHESTSEKICATVGLLLVVVFVAMVLIMPSIR